MVITTALIELGVCIFAVVTTCASVRGHSHAVELQCVLIIFFTGDGTTRNTGEYDFRFSLEPLKSSGHFDTEREIETDE